MDKRFLLTAAVCALLFACSKPVSETASTTDAAAVEETSAGLAGAAEEVAAADAAFDASAAVAGLYLTDPKHAYITFSYLHQGYSKPMLRWRTWSGELDWDPSAPDQSTIDVTIDAASIDSGVDMFDGHLKLPDFFDVENYPEITFTSTSASLTGGNTGTLTGDLTIKGVTKPVILDVTINRAADDEFSGAYKLGFSAKGVVKRSDFGVDKYVPFVGDDVSVVIEAEFQKPKEAAPE